MKSFGYGFGFVFGGKKIDSQALAHFNRVVADGGTLPAGLVGCDAWFKAVKGVYGVSDITSAISSGIHPHYLGYKAGAGSGATLGSAAQTCYNAIGSTGDVVQTTAASQPLILPHTGTNYTWLPGVAGNFFSTPNAAANQITGDIEIIVDIAVPTWTPSVQSTIVSKWRDAGGAAYSYLLRIMADGTLRLITSSNGSNTIDAISTSSVSLPINTIVYLKFVRQVNNGSGGNSTFFYTSTNRTTWTQLGATIINTGVTSIFASSSTLQIGANDINGALNPINAQIHRVTISNTIGGNPVVDFNPANYSRATSGTTWTSTTGEVWTLNTPSTNNALKAAIVDTTYLMGNGTSIGMRAASLNINSSAFTQYSGFRKFVNSLGAQIITELGFISGNPGIGFYINDSVNVESIYLRGNVGIWQTSFTSTNLGLKLSTAVYNTANANECLPYLINNVAQTVSGTPATNNNSGTLNSTDFNLLGRANASSLWANVMFACNIITKQEDSTGTQTAMYTALKPFLVNAI